MAANSRGEITNITCGWGRKEEEIRRWKDQWRGGGGVGGAKGSGRMEGHQFRREKIQEGGGKKAQGQMK